VAIDLAPRRVTLETWAGQPASVRPHPLAMKFPGGPPMTIGAGRWRRSGAGDGGPCRRNSATLSSLPKSQMLDLSASTRRTDEIAAAQRAHVTAGDAEAGQFADCAMAARAGDAKRAVSQVAAVCGGCGFDHEAQGVADRRPLIIWRASAGVLGAKWPPDAPASGDSNSGMGALQRAQSALRWLHHARQSSVLPTTHPRAYL
jgi:hypothetical protein